ncbi:hypothetical protein KFL_008010060 [Klebsormidium nitens]|uniref:Uncharacterized protein n=1 Tax=Klebsormidium nitens TaxID=105231 RepID=A0A1Y1IQK5_KLENI|nr:hypothetical protein KFL_008010060 [Klebsormidium nitens]|eukprot:GAQ91531.1 hypothetical protein KFL_008010060 [Klebsormidium nitens]
MEKHEKRKQEEAVLSNGKRQRDQELLVHGSTVLPDGPPVDFKTRLAEPLGDAMMVVGGAAPNQVRRLTVARVLSGAFKAGVMMDLSKIESCPMLLPSYFPRPTPIQSEAISNDDMQLTVFDVVNFVLRQFSDYTLGSTLFCQTP